MTDTVSIAATDGTGHFDAFPVRSGDNPAGAVIRRSAEVLAGVLG